MIRHLKNISLAPFNSFGIDVLAAHMFVIKYTHEMIEMFQLPSFTQLIEHEPAIPILVLGGGSNILLCNDYKGIVIKNEIEFITKINETDTEVFVEVGAGVLWQNLVNFAIQNQWGGLENLSLIPGHVGAAPIQNIGAYGVEVASVIEAVHFFHLENRQMLSLNNADCAFGYRDSIFKNKLKNKTIICSIVFKLQKQPVLNTVYKAIQEVLIARDVKTININEISLAVIAIRQSKLPDPKILGNAGSFFKNPIIEESAFKKLQAQFPNVKYHQQGQQYKIYAGWLIENDGWKGFRKNQVGCYSKQALILVNYGGASGKEIIDLYKQIQQSVFEKFGIFLTPEVNVIE